MLQKLFQLTLVFFLFTLISCDKDTFEPHEEGLWVRVINNSGFALNNVQAQGIDFGKLSIGETTDYVELFEPMFLMATVSADKNKETYYYSQFCMTGVPIASEGAFTVHIDELFDDGNWLSVRLISDLAYEKGEGEAECIVYCDCCG